MKTDKDIADRVRAIAAAQPDRRYEKPVGGRTCMYVHGDKPGCIMGQALHAEGVPLEILAEGEGLAVGSVLWHLEDWVTRDLSQPWVSWLGHVQAGQDSGKTWGGSVQFADQMCGEAAILSP